MRKPHDSSKCVLLFVVWLYASSCVQALYIVSPPELKGEILSPLASFGPDPDQSGTYEIVLASPLNACHEFDNPEHFKGKLVLASRGDCIFVAKARRAQRAGAAGLLIMNEIREQVPSQMFGFAPDIRIPCAMIARARGEDLQLFIQYNQKIIGQWTNANTVDLTLMENDPNQDDYGIEASQGSKLSLISAPRHDSEVATFQRLFQPSVIVFAIFYGIVFLAGLGMLCQLAIERVPRGSWLGRMLGPRNDPPGVVRNRSKVDPMRVTVLLLVMLVGLLRFLYWAVDPYGFKEIFPYVVYSIVLDGMAMVCILTLYLVMVFRWIATYHKSLQIGHRVGLVGRLKPVFWASVIIFVVAQVLIALSWYVLHATYRTMVFWRAVVEMVLMFSMVTCYTVYGILLLCKLKKPESSMSTHDQLIIRMTKNIIAGNVIMGVLVGVKAWAVISESMYLKVMRWYITEIVDAVCSVALCIMCIIVVYSHQTRMAKRETITVATRALPPSRNSRWSNASTAESHSVFRSSSDDDSSVHSSLLPRNSLAAHAIPEAEEDDQFNDTIHETIHELPEESIYDAHEESIPDLIETSVSEEPQFFYPAHDEFRDEFRQSTRIMSQKDL